MITANEAFKRSENRYKNYMSHVKEIAKNELENYITEKIEFAISKGFFSTEYWWGLSWFGGQEINPEDFLSSLQEELESYGYEADINQIEDRCIIKIYWDQAEEA